MATLYAIEVAPYLEGERQALLLELGLARGDDHSGQRRARFEEEYPDLLRPLEDIDRSGANLLFPFHDHGEG